MSLLPWAVLVLAARAADPWERPDHLRVAAEPPRVWRDLDARKRRVRLWWDAGDAPVEIQALIRGRWRTVAQDAEPGWTSDPLPLGVALRARREGQPPGRWSPVLTAPTAFGPTDLAGLAAEPGAVLGARVGQLSFDPATGDTWATTLGGGALQVTEAGESRAWTAWEGLPDGFVIDVHAREGEVLLGTGQGALLVVEGQPVRVWDAAELPSSHVQAVALGPDGTRWLGTDAGLAREQAGALATLLGPPGVYSIHTDTRGGAWVGWEGLRRVEPDGTRGVLPGIDSDSHVYDLAFSGERLWVATEEQGVVELRPDGAREVVGLPAYGLAVRDGALWAAAGVDGLRDAGGRLHGRESGLPGDTVWSVEPGRVGLWVGTDGGLAWLRPGAGGMLPTSDVWAPPRSRWPADARADALLLRKNGLVVGGDAGLTRVGNVLRDGDDLIVGARQPVVALLADGHGGAWAVGPGAVHLDRRGDLRLVELPGVARDAALLGDDLYVVLPSGLHRVAAGSERAELLTAADDLTRISAAGAGLWVVQSGRLMEWIDGALIPVPAAGQVLSVSADPAQPGHVWVGGLAGLRRVGSRASGGALPVEIPVLDDVIAAIPAVAADGEGGVWFATGGGRVARLGVDLSLHWLDLPVLPAVVGIDVDPRDPSVAWLRTVRGTWRVRAP
ncbi:MAG: hypothetical protein H6742_01900 [Alphaproteobacteria bacterium]|nr:hypothetical protein [Alphaproteobacteria bacterium]